MHRFTSEEKIQKHWSGLLKLFDKSPELKKFLDDKGKGSPPEVYNVQVETGLRNFGNDKYAMGTYAMISKMEWQKDNLSWKKRECYIAMARYVLELPSYSKYIHFRWSDYVSRNAMTMTFKARHLPYTLGEEELTGIVDPAEWSTPVKRHKRKRTGVHAITPSSHVVSPGSTTSVATATTTATCWDSEEGEWVSP